MNINILTPFLNHSFLRQISSSYNDQGYNFYEKSTADIFWDIVIVYEGINNETSLNCKKNGLVFITGEAPWSNYYSSEFVRQFDHVITSHKRIKHPSKLLTQQSLPWHIGYDRKMKVYNSNIDSLRASTFPEKTKGISIISSTKRMMPGQRKRIKFIESLKKYFGSSIDYYGDGINPIDDKASALIPYRFSICIENFNIDDCWSEKISDPFLAYTQPIYFGCKNIFKYFPQGSLQSIDINNKIDSFRIIENTLNNLSAIYDSSLPLIVEARDLIFERYNIDKIILDLYCKLQLEKENNYQYHVLKKNEYFRGYKYGMGILRLKRLLLRPII